MILQALNDYYQRKSADPNAHMAPPGFEWKEIPFVIELDNDGKLVQIEDTREGNGKKKIARRFLLPQGVKKTSGVAANLFWDNAEYVLGVDIKGKPERLREQRNAFIANIKSLPPDALADVGVAAVLKFIETVNLGELEKSAVWPDIVEANPNLTFRLQNETGLVSQRSVVVRAIESLQGTGAADGICMISGEVDEIERLHTSVKGVWGAQSSGANIVSFNLDAFNSYGKTQGNNAPIGKRTAFAYTTGLNYLLHKDSRQRIQVGDSSTVFWAEKTSELESAIPDIFGEPPKDDPDRNVRAVESLYRSIQSGAFHHDGGKDRFYVLGLAPNAARIAIRFWYVSTVAELAIHIRSHFDDIKIGHASFEKPYISLFRLLITTATQGKADNIPPNLAGDMMRSVLSGTPYPQTLLQAAARRTCAEREISYPRAALIKACINRQIRYDHTNEKELTVSLDEANLNVGYRLGRLFAALEKIQEDANPGINATIRDRYYGSASSTPMTVFSTLIKLSKHHLSKLQKEKPGLAVNREKLMGEIIGGIQDFPSLMPLIEQGRFAIGYYHQQQAFYQKSESKTQGE